MIWTLASVSQDEAFDSIRQNLGREIDITLVFWAGVTIVLIAGAIIYFNQRMRRSSEGMNHMGKLLKEISQEVGLKPGEIKKLRELAGRMDEPVRKNPMVLLLCPSLLSKAMKKK